MAAPPRVAWPWCCRSAPSEVGDEPLLIAQQCRVPVYVASQRTLAASTLLAQHPEVDVLVCDDGLQHLALQRDLEICVFNPHGTGNGFLLPAGPLREPWPRRVDRVLYTGCAADQPPQPQSPVALSASIPICGPPSERA